MKKKRSKIFLIIGISALSLLGLIAIQVNWIFHTAQLREQQLKHRLATASTHISYWVSKDSLLTANIAEKVKENDGKKLNVNIGSKEQTVLDSLIKNKFEYQQVDLPYSFRLVDKRHPFFKSTCYNQQISQRICLEGVLEPNKKSKDRTAKAEIRIFLPEMMGYVWSRMGWIVIVSAIMVALTSGGFILTVRTVLRQKKMSEMTTDFINNMTHELKTPIATVSLASNMLRKEKILDNREKIVHYSSVIHEENKKLQDQVEQVLRIAKVEKGEYTLNKVQADIHTLVLDAIATIDLQVREKGGKVQYYLNAMRHTVMADVVHITNVISNLLDNANKYTSDTPEIIVETKDLDNGVVISVTDNGIGMSKEMQKHIFDKFYRVSTGNIHDVKGFGLGLAYVKMMIDAHKGNIELKSELGKGSCFKIFLPYTA